MAVDTSTAGELTAEQVQSILVQPLEEASTFLAAGPRIFDSANQVRIPKLGAPTAPSWVDENALIPEQDPTFDEVTLLPSTMQSVKVLTRYSNELSRQSIVSLDAALKQRLVSDVAATVDSQLWSATGDGITKPQGILAYTGTQELPLTAALTLDDLHDAHGLALAGNVNMSGLRWVMTPAQFTLLRKIKDTTDRYQLTPDPTTDGVFRLLGAPVTVTSHLPAGNVVLADFSQIAVARDVAPSVKILDQTFGDYDQQAIRVVTRLDAAPLNAEAVVKITGIV